MRSLRRPLRPLLLTPTFSSSLSHPRVALARFWYTTHYALCPILILPPAVGQCISRVSPSLARYFEAISVQASLEKPKEACWKQDLATRMKSENLVGSASTASISFVVVMTRSPNLQLCTDTLRRCCNRSADIKSNYVLPYLSSLVAYVLAGCVPYLWPLPETRGPTAFCFARDIPGYPIHAPTHPFLSVVTCSTLSRPGKKPTDNLHTWKLS